MSLSTALFSLEYFNLFHMNFPETKSAKAPSSQKLCGSSVVEIKAGRRRALGCLPHTLRIERRRSSSCTLHEKHLKQLWRSWCTKCVTAAHIKNTVHILKMKHALAGKTFHQEFKHANTFQLQTKAFSSFCRRRQQWDAAVQSVYNSATRKFLS